MEGWFTRRNELSGASMTYLTCLTMGKLAMVHDYMTFKGTPGQHPVGNMLVGDPCDSLCHSHAPGGGGHAAQGIRHRRREGSATRDEHGHKQQYCTVAIASKRWTPQFRCWVERGSTLLWHDDCGLFLAEPADENGRNGQKAGGCPQGDLNPNPSIPYGGIGSCNGLGTNSGLNSGPPRGAEVDVQKVPLWGLFMLQQNPDGPNGTGSN